MKKKKNNKNPSQTYCEIWSHIWKLGRISTSYQGLVDEKAMGLGDKGNQVLCISDCWVKSFPSHKICRSLFICSRTSRAEAEEKQSNPKGKSMEIKREVAIGGAGR